MVQIIYLDFLDFSTCKAGIITFKKVRKMTQPQKPSGCQGMDHASSVSIISL